MLLILLSLFSADSEMVIWFLPFLHMHTYDHCWIHEHMCMPPFLAALIHNEGMLPCAVGMVLGHFWEPWPGVSNVRHSRLLRQTSQDSVDRPACT